MKTPAQRKPKIEMLVDTAGEETRVAICRNGRLDELWVECSDRLSLVGNIYKGKVTKVERGIQAAFVDFGAERDGFLHINDVHRRYFPKRRRHRSTEKVGKRVRRSDRPPIEDCLARGDEIAIQVVKDSYGRKGAAMTTYLSIPGRTLVMLANSDGTGVSRRVDEEGRRRLRELLSGIQLPDGVGFILRTAGSGSSKNEIQADVRFLARQWEEIQSLLESRSAP
ncbi:MAG: ribonuclease E/G, partial [Deltaproteobacteria bacterium]|nr:ribonuclease E/G [Deltaproteobacteria bacterium]